MENEVINKAVSPDMVVDMTKVNLAKVDEVNLAIAKAKVKYNKENPDFAIELMDFEKKLLKKANRWFKRLYRMIKKVLGWK